ncbi:MAG: hypothetical protein RLZZ215_3360 [Pseudomonadota bacterium]|jgi:hypothetical protein
MWLKKEEEKLRFINGGSLFTLPPLFAAQALTHRFIQTRWPLEAFPDT